MRWRNLVPLAALAILLVGCSDLGAKAARYRAERMVWDAHREERRLTVGTAKPDSAALLRVRAAYGRLRKTFRPPFAPGSGENAARIRRAVAREVGMAELTGAAYAMRARRPDLALESARWVTSIASADTGLLREAAFTEVRALRLMRRYEEAVAKMRGMLAEFPPVSPPTPGSEDQILGVPDMIIELRAALGDSLGARRERDWALAYYRGLLARGEPPVLAAQVRARLIRTLLEQGNAGAARAEAAELRKLVALTPSLKPLEPEVLYSEARILSMGQDPKAALDEYDLVVMNYPSSPYAVRALFDAAVINERLHDRRGALVRYRAILDRSKPDPAFTPLASFRMAMVLDQLGNWVEAKAALEAIPLRFPQSRAALESPFAIVEHYARAGEGAAVKSALLRAVDTYRALIAQDTTSIFCTAYRLNIFRAYVGLQRWNEALAAVDEMAARDAGAPITAQALFEGGRIATAQHNDARAQAYFQRLVLEYPRSPLAGPVRKYLQEQAKTVKKK